MGEQAMAQRAEAYASGSDMGRVAQTLTAQRDDILERWVADASAQPFHQGRRQRAVADHIPALFDALVQVLHEAAPRWTPAGMPLEDARVRAAAAGHALARSAQGLSPAEVIVEFRLLRQEVLRAIRRGVPDDAPATDIVGTELILNDCLDGASALALNALADHVAREGEEFLAHVVHETRQPLAIIVGNLGLAERALARDEPDLGRLRAQLGGANAAAKRLRTLLDTLVDTSRVALGGLQLRREPCDLRAILAQSLAHLPADATGRWDADRLLQVVSNLLGNAAKYAPGDSPIIAALEGDAATVALAIRDQGLGIPAEDLPRLFARYSRASNVHAGQIEGLGLGLYLCRGIVEAHGGRIWAESPGPGRGATFSIALPREPGPGN